MLKHNNACGVATRSTIAQAWRDALAGDPVSARSAECSSPTALSTKRLPARSTPYFYEVIIAPAYTDCALQILQQKRTA